MSRYSYSTLISLARKANEFVFCLQIYASAEKVEIKFKIKFKDKLQAFFFNFLFSPFYTEKPGRRKLFSLGFIVRCISFERSKTVTRFSHFVRIQIRPVVSVQPKNFVPSGRVALYMRKAMYGPAR